MLRGGETRCSAVWSAHLFWVQRAIGSNPVTLMWRNNAFFTLSSQNAITQRGRPRMLASQTLAANGQHVRYDILAHLKKIPALLSV